MNLAASHTSPPGSSDQAWISRRSWLFFGLAQVCAPFSHATEATLFFMGVQVANANIESIKNALEANGGKKSSEKKLPNGTEVHVFSFTNDSLPSGIRALSALFDSKKELIHIEAKIPPGKFWEKEGKAQSEKMLNLLTSKYGRPNKTNESANVLGKTFEYLWYFQDGGTISFEAKGALTGSRLRYINSIAEEAFLNARNKKATSGF